MEDKAAGIRTAERLAGLIAMIAALVVLNGAWVNQHNWQNVSWRVAVAGILVVLAVMAETSFLGLLRRQDDGEPAVPDFLRAAPDTTEPPAAESVELPGHEPAGAKRRSS